MPRRGGQLYAHAKEVTDAYDDDSPFKGDVLVPPDQARKVWELLGIGLGSGFTDAPTGSSMVASAGIPLLIGRAQGTSSAYCLASGAGPRNTAPHALEPSVCSDRWMGTNRHG